jgi:hypothetical protein
MASRQTTVPRSRERVIVNGLWIASGLVVLTGFLLRPLARYVGGHDLRITAMVVIAIGLAIAVLGWIGEKVLERRRLG